MSSTRDTSHSRSALLKLAGRLACRSVGCGSMQSSQPFGSSVVSLGSWGSIRPR